MGASVGWDSNRGIGELFLHEQRQSGDRKFLRDNREFTLPEWYRAECLWQVNLLHVIQDS